MDNDSSFHQFSKQSVKGILVIYANLLFKVFKATWVLLFLFVQRFSKLPELAIVSIYIGLAVLLFFFLVRAYLVYKNFLFKIEDAHFVLKQGIIKKTNTSISFDRIQNINFKQNIIQQLINVYEVSIETAGSKDTEIAIKALTFERAQALKTTLSQVEISTEKTANTSEPEPLLKIGFLELLKVSFTENHLQNLLVFVALLFGILQQVKDVFSGLGKEDAIEDYMNVNPDTIFNSLVVLIILILILLVIGVISSFVRILLFHFNLTLYIKDSSFNITQGLLTKKSIILKKEKVQSITVSTNPIKRILGVNFVTFKQAVSGRVNKKQNKLIRIIGCKRTQIKLIKAVLYANDTIDNQPKYKPNVYYVYRMYFRSLLGLILLNSMIIFLIKDFIWLYGNILAIPLLVVLIHLKFKKSSYQFTNDMLLVANGRIETHRTYLPLFKVQNIIIKQTIFQQRRNVVNLVLQTASGKIRIPCIEKDRAINLYNYILFKVESNNQSWM